MESVYFKCFFVCFPVLCSTLFSSVSTRQLEQLNSNFCHTMVNKGLIYCSMLCSHCGHGGRGDLTGAQHQRRD